MACGHVDDAASRCARGGLIGPAWKSAKAGEDGVESQSMVIFYASEEQKRSVKRVKGRKTASRAETQEEKLERKSWNGGLSCNHSQRFVPWRRSKLRTRSSKWAGSTGGWVAWAGSTGAGRKYLTALRLHRHEQASHCCVITRPATNVADLGVPCKLLSPSIRLPPEKELAASRVTDNN